MSSLLPQVTPSAAGTAGGKAYMAEYGAIIAQNMISAPAHLQAPPKTACTAAIATTARMAGTADPAGMATTAHIAPQTGLFTGTLTLKFISHDIY